MPHSSPAPCFSVFRQLVLLVALSGFLTACGGSDDETPTPSEPIEARIHPTGTSYEIGDTVSLHIYASSGDIEYVEWTFPQWPAESLAEPDVVDGIEQIQFTPDVPGNYTVRLTLTDIAGNTDSDELTITATNTAPSADVTPNYALYSIEGDELTFSAAASSDPNGQELSYSWVVIEKPVDSNATLSNTTGVETSLVADVSGDYVVEVEVSDGYLTSTAQGTHFVKINNPPILGVSQWPALLGLDPLTIDASGSYDLEGRALSFQWELASSPAASNPEFSVDGAVARLEPDVMGDYEVVLTVSDGYHSVTKTLPIAQYEEFLQIDTELGDARYDDVNDRIVMVSSSSNELLLIDAMDGAVQRMALPAAPVALSLSEDGSTVLVSHVDSFSVIDLDTLSVDLQLPLPAEPKSVVFGGNGYAYFFPAYGQHTNATSIELATGAMTTDSSRIYEGQLARRQPGQATIYSVDTRSFPNHYIRFDISGGLIQLDWEIPYHGDYELCGNLWFNDDGSSIISGCGVMFTTSANQESDMIFDGRLERREGMEVYRQQLFWLDHSADQSTYATVESVELDHDLYALSLARYNSMDRSLIEEIGIPKFKDASGVRSLAPKFVFHQGANDAVLLLADVEGDGTTQTLIIKR